MKCEFCGKITNKNNTFCPSCGARLIAKEADVKPEPKVAVEESIEDNFVEPKKHKLATAGMVLGLLGVCMTSFILSVLGIIFGAVSVSRLKGENSEKSDFAKAGLVLGIVGLIIWVVIKICSSRMSFILF